MVYSYVKNKYRSVRLGITERPGQNIGAARLRSASRDFSLRDIGDTGLIKVVVRGLPKGTRKVRDQLPFFTLPVILSLTRSESLPSKLADIVHIKSPTCPVLS